MLFEGADPICWRSRRIGALGFFADLSAAATELYEARGCEADVWPKAEK